MARTWYFCNSHISNYFIFLGVHILSTSCYHAQLMRVLLNMYIKIYYLMTFDVKCHV